MMNDYTFVDVSGVGSSGKSAVVDLLREFDEVYAPPFSFEFDFLRVPNGLFDLRHRLVEDWSPIRSHYGLRAFLDVAERMGCDPHWWDLRGLMRSTSQRYDRHFAGRFCALTRAFAESFVQTSFAAEWPYDSLSEPGWLGLARKILRRIGFRANLFRTVIVPSGKNFDEKARAYLNELYRGIVPAETKFIVLNNGIEPFQPLCALDMLGDARQIVITRDPRDIYVSGLNAHNVMDGDRELLAFDNDGANKSFLATDDLAVFVKRTLTFYEQVYRGGDPRVLHVRFEDLVLNFEETKTKICRFLDLDRARHVRPGTYLDLKKSAKNIGVWRKSSRRSEVAYIERELKEFLFDG